MSACSVYVTEELAPLEAVTVAVRVIRPFALIDEPDDASRLAFPALPSRSMPDPDDEEALIFLAVMHSAFVLEPEEVSILRPFIVADFILISLPEEVLAEQLSHFKEFMLIYPADEVFRQMFPLRFSSFSTRILAPDEAFMFSTDGAETYNTAVRFLISLFLNRSFSIENRSLKEFMFCE